MKYEIYLDVFWLTNFAMDFLVLLLVRHFRRRKSALWRVFLSSAFGATASLILFLGLKNFIGYQLCMHLLVNPVMLLFGFPQKNLKSVGKDILYTYGITLLLGGIMSWGMETLRQWKYFFIWALGGLGICMLILHWLENRREESLCYEILLITNQNKLILTGFLDTGNLLKDPIMRQPVHIIQEELLKDTLTEEQLPIRYIPFHSLGQEQGLLPVVTLNAMYVKRLGERKDVMPAYIEKPVFGLAREKLFQQKSYQVILNAGCNLA